MEVVSYCVNKKRLFLVGVIFFLLMFISGIYSLSDELNDTVSTLSTGAVDIEIKEYDNNDGPFLEDGKSVMPGDEILLVPKVHNLGIECYLRAKITYSIENEVFNEQDYITGNYSSWTKDGEYYYYNSTLEKNGVVELFNKVVIPDSLTQEYYGKKIIIHIVVDAIQEKNFDGNWNGVTIKKSVDRTYDINYEGESSIIYENDVKNHIKIRDGYFDNLGNMLPGDSISEEIEILNKDKGKHEYYLAIDYNDLTDDEINLLKNIKLIIRDSKGNILVNSNLYDKSKHSLGVYPGGKGDKLTIELSLPKDVDNDFSKLLTRIIWKFSIDDIKDRIDNDGLINPNTWDLKFDLSITVFIISALGLIIVLIIEKYSTDNIEKNKREERN